MSRIGHLLGVRFHKKLFLIHNEMNMSVLTIHINVALEGKFPVTYGL